MKTETVESIMARRGQPPRYCAYELLQDGLPVLVGFGPHPAPWLTFWNFREHDDSPRGRWLRYLSDPPPLGWWHIGFIGPIGRPYAETAARVRVEELKSMGIELPYNPIRTKGSRVEVQRIFPDGRQERYSTVLAASRATGIARRDIMRHVDMGYLDPSGAFWAAL
jgi:hypothetical protein